MFPGRVWAYECSTCHHLFLKPTAGMAAWREGVARKADEDLARAVAALPESQCRRGTCNTCSRQEQRSKGRSSAQQAALTRPPPPVAACAAPDFCSNVSPSQVLEPAKPVAPPPTLPPPQAIAYQDACPEPARRPPAAHLPDSPVKAAHNPPGIPIEHPTVMPSPAPVTPHHPAAQTCKQVLEALLAGQFTGAEDQAYLGRIASAVLLHGTPNVLKLTRGNGTIAVYTRRVTPRLVRVKKSQTNKRLAAARK